MESRIVNISLLVIIALAVLSINLPSVHSRAMSEETDPNRAEDATTHSASSKTGCCNIFENGQLFALMDRICELCQDMIGQERPNMRAECSADCFRSSTFKKCLRVFKPIIRGSSSLRRANRILKQMAETFNGAPVQNA